MTFYQRLIAYAKILDRFALSINMYVDFMESKY